MITLTTGGPGTGKTAWLINQLMEIKKMQPYREFFIHGIREFTGFKHTTIYCKSPLCDLCRMQEIPEGAWYVEEYPTWYKSHFLIVVDEVQRIWTKSTGGSTDAISRLQTHRHYGLDFWLVSQSPKLIHADVKAMVGRHIHLVSKWSGRKEFEWPEVQENTGSRTDAVERAYKLPKHVFKLYKSAEVHTKQDKRKPLSFYATIIAIILAVVGVSAAVYRLKARVSTVDQKSVTVEPAGALAPVGSMVTQPQTVSHDRSPMATPEQVIKAMTPVIVGLPWSAPIYYDLSKPVSMPILVGCIKSAKVNDDRCACYTQQGTLVEISNEVCNLYVQHKPFNHFKPDLIARNDKAAG